MVNVYLLKTDGGWIHCLAIPLEDIERLSLRPLKWLRFVIFTVSGAKGHLSDTPGGNVVDYENISLADLTEDANYYFTPEGNAPHLQLSSTDKVLRNRELPSCRFLRSKRSHHLNFSYSAPL